MNVYIYNELSIASAYGIGTYVNELVSCMKDELNINVILAQTNDKEFEIENKDGVRYWKIPVPVYRTNEMDEYYFTIATFLKAYITEDELSNLVFHLNYLHNNHSLAKYLKQTFQCKIVTTVHYMEWALNFNGNFNQVEKVLNENDLKSTFVSLSLRAEKKLLDLSDRIICLTNYSSDLVSNIYGIDLNKISVIPNGLRDMFEKRTYSDLRKKYHFPCDEKIILFVGRLDYIKGLSFLIEAFRFLLLKDPNIHLLIVGGGKKCEYYMEKTSDIARKVSYTGRIERNNLYELMNIADVGVMPSLYEPFGYVALEMMMHSLPIVSTSCLNEILDDNINAKLVPISDSESGFELDARVLSEAIDFLLSEKSIAMQLGREGRKKFEERYEIRYMQYSMLKLYNNLFINQNSLP